MNAFVVSLVILAVCLTSRSAAAAIPSAQEQLALETFATAIPGCLGPAQHDLFDGALVAIYGKRATHMESAERTRALGKIMDMTTQRLRMHWTWCRAVEYGILVHAKATGLTQTTIQERVRSAQFADRCSAAIASDSEEPAYYTNVQKPGGQCLMRANREARYIRMAIF